jgi:hypothetical protein
MKNIVHTFIQLVTFGCLLSVQVTGQGLNVENSATIEMIGSPTVEIENGHLQLNGDYIKSTEKISLTGSQAVNISGSNTQKNIYNLEISNTAGATTLLNELSLDKLDILSQGIFIIDTTKHVSVTNTVSNNASTNGIFIKAHANAANGSLVFANCADAPVSATVEMYSMANWTWNNGVRTNYKWQFFGIPVQNLQYTSPLFDGSFMRKQNEAGIGAGFSASNMWIQLVGSDPIENISGYEIVQEAAKIYSFSGQLYNQSFTKVLSYTTGASYPGQHILGNPYTAAIDIEEIVFGKYTVPEIYLYNTGSYNEWISGTKTGSSAGQYTVSTPLTAGAEGIPNTIASMQGFLVKATKSSDSATIYIPYSSAIKKNCDRLRAKKVDQRVYTVIEVNGNRYSDRMWLFSDPSLTRGYDRGWDGKKLTGSTLTPQIYGKEESGNYQIDAVDNFDNTILSFKKGEDTNYKIKFTHFNTVNSYNQLYLLDLKTNDLIDITVNGTEYSFTANNTTAEPRFKIMTSAGVTTGNDNQQTDFYVNCIDNKFIINNLSGLNGNISLFDSKGVNIKNVNYTSDKTTVFELELPVGDIIYKAMDRNGKITTGKLHFD